MSKLSLKDQLALARLPCGTCIDLRRQLKLATDWIASHKPADDELLQWQKVIRKLSRTDQYCNCDKNAKNVAIDREISSMMKTWTPCPECDGMK